MQIQRHKKNEEEYFLILESSELTDKESPLFACWRFNYNTNLFERIKKTLDLNEAIALDELTRKGINRDTGKPVLSTFGREYLTSLFNYIHDKYIK